MSKKGALLKNFSFPEITERERMEEESNVRAQLLDSATDSIWVHDFDGNFVYVNEAAYKSRGYTKDEFMKMNLHDVVAPQHAERIESINKSVVEKGGYTFEGTHLCKDGSLIQVESHARTIKWGDRDLIFSVIRDITERKRVEEVLRESQVELSAIFNLAPIVMIIVDQEYQVRKANRTAVEFAGRSEAEMVGLRGGEAIRCLHSLDDSRGCGFGPSCKTCTVRCTVVDTFETGNRHYQVEASLPFRRGKKEEELTFLLSTTILGTSENQTVLLSLVDITERKQAERELQEKNEQLDAQNEELQSQSEELIAQQQELMEKTREVEEASRLKSEFLANMSHELRTPLNAVIGFSELMLDGVPGEINDEQKQCLNDIYGSGQHLLNLINDVLDLSKVEAGKIKLNLESLELAGVIKSVAQTVKPMLDNNRHELRTIIEEGLPQVRADRGRLKEIFFNLLSNAIKFTPPGGKLSIEVSRNGDWCQVSVVDNGIGIREEDREQIFETFTQGEALPDRKREGTGLGLTLTRQFVELFGGKIWVESKYGKGSRFTFTLPLATAD